MEATSTSKTKKGSAKTHADRRALKEGEVGVIRERFGKAASAVLTDFRGVNVESVTQLRREFRNVGVEYRVVKNTLVRRAIAGTPIDKIDKFLVGMTGIAWSYGDPSTAAKIITAFRKQNDKLQVKCCWVDGQVLDAGGVEDLSKMPGKDELRAKFLATLQAPMQQFLRLLAAAPQNFLYALDAREKQLKEKENG